MKSLFLKLLSTIFLLSLISSCSESTAADKPGLIQKIFSFTNKSSSIKYDKVVEESLASNQTHKHVRPAAHGLKGYTSTVHTNGTIVGFSDAWYEHADGSKAERITYAVFTFLDSDTIATGNLKGGASNHKTEVWRFYRDSWCQVVTNLSLGALKAVNLKTKIYDNSYARSQFLVTSAEGLLGYIAFQDNKPTNEDCVGNDITPLNSNQAFYTPAEYLEKEYAYNGASIIGLKMTKPLTSVQSVYQPATKNLFYFWTTESTDSEGNTTPGRIYAGVFDTNNDEFQPTKIFTVLVGTEKGIDRLFYPLRDVDLRLSRLCEIDYGVPGSIPTECTYQIKGAVYGNEVYPINPFHSYLPAPFAPDRRFAREKLTFAKNLQNLRYWNPYFITEPLYNAYFERILVHGENKIIMVTENNPISYVGYPLELMPPGGLNCDMTNKDDCSLNAYPFYLPTVSGKYLFNKYREIDVSKFNQYTGQYDPVRIEPQELLNTTVPDKDTILSISTLQNKDTGLGNKALITLNPIMTASYRPLPWSPANAARIGPFPDDFYSADFVEVTDRDRKGIFGTTIGGSKAQVFPAKGNRPALVVVAVKSTETQGTPTIKQKSQTTGGVLICITKYNGNLPTKEHHFENLNLQYCNKMREDATPQNPYPVGYMYVTAGTITNYGEYLSAPAEISFTESPDGNIWVNYVSLSGALYTKNLMASNQTTFQSWTGIYSGRPSKCTYAIASLEKDTKSSFWNTYGPAIEALMAKGAGKALSAATESPIPGFAIELGWKYFAKDVLKQGDVANFDHSKQLSTSCQ